MTAPLATTDLPPIPAYQPLPPELTEPRHDEHRKELELAVAAGILVAFTVIRDRLRDSHGDPRQQAGKAWQDHEPLWRKLLVPALLDAWRAHRIEAPVPDMQMQLVAAAYSDALGSYLEATSGEAFAAGIQRQVDGGIEARTAWSRAAAAYGLDLRDMRGYVSRLASLLTAPQEQVIPPAAKDYIDKSTMVRVDLISRSEAHTSMQTMKSLAWAAMQRSGMLPPGAAREWDTAEDESTCPTCAPLDGVRVPVSEPFQVGLRAMLAPQAHPGCRCVVRLFVPEFLRKAANDGWKTQPRGGPDNAGEFGRKPQKAVPKRAAPRPQVAEQVRTADPQVEAMMAQARLLATKEQEVAEEVETNLQLGAPLSLGTPMQLNSLSLNPMKLSDLSLNRGLSLGEPKLSLGLSLGEPDETPEPLSLHDRKPTPRRVLIIAVPPEEKNKPRPDELHMSANEWALAMGHHMDGLFRDGEDIDFATAQHNARYGLRAYDSSPWHAPDPSLVFVKRNMDPNEHRDLIDEQWRQACEMAHPLWQKVVRNPSAGIKHLNDNELRDIVRTGGQIADDDIKLMDRDDLRDHIMADTKDLRTYGEAPTAEAFADYLVWRKPQVLGKDGPALADFLDGARDTSVFLADHDVEEVFSFSPAEARQGDIKGAEIRPSGHYMVAAHTYKSALNDYGSHPPTLHRGIILNHMSPIYVQRGGWKAGRAGE